MRTSGDGSGRRAGRSRATRFAPFLLFLLLAPPSAGAAATAPPVDVEETAPLPFPEDAAPAPARVTAALDRLLRVRVAGAPLLEATPDEHTEATVAATPPAMWVPAKAGVNATPPPIRVTARLDPEHEGIAVAAAPGAKASHAANAPGAGEPWARALSALEPMARQLRHDAPELAGTLARAVRAAAGTPTALGDDRAETSRAQAVAAPDLVAPPLDAQRVAAIAAGMLALLLAPCYHRLRGPRVLDQDTRGRIFALVQARPAILAVEVARELGLDRTTVRYHLRRLVREGLVCAEGPAHFAAGSLAREARAACVAAARSARVLDAVRQHPGRAKNDLAEAVGLARATVSWHLDRLAAAGLVRLAREGRSVRAWPDDDALRSAGLA